MDIVCFNSTQPGKKSAAVHAARAFLLWRNTRMPLADAIEKVCGVSDEAHLATVMLLCQLKFMGDQQ